jgi:hypothetical protein
VIRVVIVRVERGWLALFSTDPALTAEGVNVSTGLATLVGSVGFK